jgi:adenine phosphoribosyltransferase
MTVETLRAAIRDIPDFPTPGILFKDITPVLLDRDLFRMAVKLFVDRYADRSIDKIAVIEARGFIFGSAVAHELGAGLIPIRKKGKLPFETLEASYDLEYGSATLEIHVDAVQAGQRVLILDDLLATGGTAAATAALVRKLGGEVVGLAFLIELAFLKGRDKLTGYEIFAPLVFDG